ncbi:MULTISPECIES: Type 1 glutamine amidotransferase-like domain-containing protein [Rhodococcus]|uniref:Type 1 glutamine amidotransferase-like domain-containing protein n=1 Tax=Rhodococcus cercidiphylli TaxID=489916 RepID=A0ABU4B5Z7_9NOCA|nr:MULTISPECIES: Type 1 glutamine amidotransferase-like domain-containing protein [Rhodococcus]MDV6233920.1 Type 1 glutamine amidotransferase-like domain-containing protein [Rhodococcus cercidiphylli]MDV8058359.1 Type 1 glutamine amidotransferase-like domain-containing protein [Rhodococcus sp. IEGM 1343]
MKLFLSSYRFGGHSDVFVELTGPPSDLAVIANASDAWPRAARESSLTSEFVPLRALGYRPAELDLREYVGRPAALERALDDFGAVWVRGGNTFVLRAQLARSGADEVIAERVRRGSIVYGGYSAGACVAAPSLIGVEDADDPGEVRPATGVDPVWTGLGLVGFSIVPHLNSVLDENDSGQATMQRLRRDGIDCRGLTDEQAIVVDASGTRVLGS